jgi:hypothetical protein
MSEKDSGLLVPNQLVGNDQPIEGVIHCGMSVDDPESVEFPEAEVPPEERARRLKVEVERWPVSPQPSGCSGSTNLPRSTASSPPS